MIPETEYPRPQIHRFTNQLPATFPTWLSLYDSILVEGRGELLFRIIVQSDRREAELLAAKNLSNTVVGYIEYAIERDYLLARVAEELLPARLHQKEVNALERALYEASKSSTNCFNGAVNLLSPLWAVARSK